MLNKSYSMVWSFRNRIGELQDSLFSAHKTCDIGVDFQLVDACSEIENLNLLKDYIRHFKDNRDVRICEGKYRTTCQEAWNLGIMLSVGDRIIIASSDVEFLKVGWFEEIDKSFNSGFDYVILGNHAVFGITRSLIKRIGFFDESFGHGPHVDVDFMIRASEAKARIAILENNGYYVHDKEALQYKDRINGEIKDRLPMGNPENEKRFFEKWQTTWPGWEAFKGQGADLPHPPTQIREVQRKVNETDWHPAYTRRIKC